MATLEEYSWITSGCPTKKATIGGKRMAPTSLGGWGDGGRDRGLLFGERAQDDNTFRSQIILLLTIGAADTVAPYSFWLAGMPRKECIRLRHHRRRRAAELAGAPGAGRGMNESQH
jgi:hypothetical protein